MNARRCLAAAFVAACTPSFATELLIDFDHHRDGSPVTVAAGQVLRDAVVLPYLAEFGITVVDRSRPDIEIRISHPTQAQAHSPANVFEAWAPTLAPHLPYSYRLVFDQPVAELSFVRAALVVAPTSHDGWRIDAYDGTGSLLGSVGEEQVTQFGGTPSAQARRFDLPYEGIASLLFTANLSSGGQTYESPVIDDLRFRVSPVPEPSSLVLFGSGLAVWAGRRRLRR